PAGRQINLASDAVVTVLDTSLPGAAALSFSTYFGGKYNDVASRLSPGRQRTVLVTGYTGSADLPVTDGSVKTTPGGGTAGFLLQLKLEPLEGQSSPPDSGPGGEDAGGSVLPRRSGPSIEPQPRRQTR
ncbi:MAG: hypothetical protein K6T61_16535, partial [Bryobacteraceae bacterium]|nr:hypothetical protein [Bryobacteraceae bacterium]